MIDQLLDQNAQELAALARHISCNFVDAQTTSKDYVRAVAERWSASRLSGHHFVLSTCLRHEIYCCDGGQIHREPFIYTSGLTCVRRLLAIQVGLLSEIIGEREISSQVARAVEAADRAGQLGSETARGLHALNLLAEHIRIRSGISTNENYSTIAADIVLEHLADKPGAVVAIIGGGYMAERFFSSLVKAQFANVRKLVWINRTTAKVRDGLGSLLDVIDIELEVIGLKEGRHALREADAVFCALAKSHELYKGAAQKRGTLVVDVSYPPVFEGGAETTLVNIANTQFDRLVRRPPLKASVSRANAEIDSALSYVQSSL